MLGSDLIRLLLLLGGTVAFILAIIFIAVPVFRGVGSAIGMVFDGIGWLVRHIFGFIFGMLGDAIRFIGALIAMVLLSPLALLNIVIGRWSAAGHFGSAIAREFNVGAMCLYRIVLQRPLKLLLLNGLLEGVEQRLPEAINAAPTADGPSRRTGQFDGYTIVGSLRSGGSGAKLYVARPEDPIQRRLLGRPERVVIKSFAISEGSSLPQILRESRALEAAKQLGLVLDHGMDDHRFFYVMPYHAGDHLGIITRQLHGESDGRGLSQGQLAQVMGYTRDLLETLRTYHQGGLWHKDVKPDNLIVHGGKAHLVDLGLVTPLRSAMTLTTHGTEYFRDPEMVRQALRGVKVHQVDGAKFDVYAAGAVLYFMLENTFPAHGGLSAFEKRGPEAVRWIVRRAMTDYSRRYTTAAAMLADVEFVMASRDVYAIKPAELPSMRGVETPNMPPTMDSATVFASAGAIPPVLEGYGIAAGIGESGTAFAQVGRFSVDAAGNPIPRDAGNKRPRLNVTNWWTGAYAVEGATDSGWTGDVDAKTFRDEARAFRDEAQRIGRSVQAGAISARKGAREQIKAARSRAAAIRTRAARHRARVVDPKNRALGVLSVVVVLFLMTIAAGILFFTFAQDRRMGREEYVTMGQTPDHMLLVLPPVPMDVAFNLNIDLLAGAHRPLILVNDHPTPTDPVVRARVQRLVAEYVSMGAEVSQNDAAKEAAVRLHLPAGVVVPSDPRLLRLHETIETQELGGIIRVFAMPGEGSPTNRMRLQLVVPSQHLLSNGNGSPAAFIVEPKLLDDERLNAAARALADLEKTIKGSRSRVEVKVQN